MSFFHICESTSCFSCSIEPWPDISVLRWCAVNWDLLLSVTFSDSSLLTEHWVVETVSNTTTLHLHPPPPWGHIENICRNDKISQKKTVSKTVVNISKYYYEKKERNLFVQSNINSKNCLMVCLALLKAPGKFNY